MRLLALFVFVIFFHANVDAASPFRSIASEIENTISGGKERPKDIYVRNIEGRFFLEGVVDHRKEREEAIEICQSFAARRIKLEETGFSKVQDLCVNRVRIRAGQPMEPPGMLRVVYSVIKIPDLSSDVGTMLSQQFYSDERLPQQARLLKSFAIEFSDASSGFPVEAFPRMPASFEEKSEKGLSVNAKIEAKSIPGTDRVLLVTDMTINQLDKNGSSKEINLASTISKGKKAALTSWTENTGDSVTGYLVTAQIFSIRQHNQ